ncbi:uroporphyrinogen decarboxylase family protein [Pantoea sp. 18069]|uniref:uroporphyrinogen decarboxylase family protein n=1 Tax=Pantoea sp. 18069 TaxID=2681415 RepID=UPI0013593591|nr:uroporphyrinogen decarboxylase family protein [Pantoea sp. 18069]
MQSMNHWQRIEAAINGEPTDRPPVALWRHFPDDDQHSDKLVAHTLQWQEKWQFDLVKFMPSGTYGVEDWGAISGYRGAANGAREVIQPAVVRTEDWRRVVPLDVRRGAYGRQNEALAAAAKVLKGQVPLLQTVFSPLTTARKMSTEKMFADLRRFPDELERALMVITDVTIRFALDALAQGAHGVFFATQLASHRLLTTAEYERFGKRYDLQVFKALRGKSRLNMLHAHGDDIMFDLLSDYPTEMFNWHDRLTDPTIAQAAECFPQLLVGGINEHGTLMHGSEQEIENQVHEALSQTGGRRLMIGPGCVLPVAARDASIRAVVRAAHQFKESSVCI